MSRRTKDYARLESLEAELMALATALLREVASGRNTWLFVTDQTNPWANLRSSPEGTDLFGRSEAILELAERLGADASQLTATKLLRGFRDANDLENANRLGPIRLAESLLASLSEAPGR
jgi:hypothetical protein